MKPDRRYTDFRTDLGEAVAALDERVVALDREIVGVHQAIEELSRRLQPQWQSWASFAGVALLIVGAFWAAGVTPIKEGMFRHDSRLDDIQAQLNQRWQLFPTQMQFNEYRHAAERERDNLQKQIDRLDTKK